MEPKAQEERVKPLKAPLWVPSRVGLGFRVQGSLVLGAEGFGLCTFPERPHWDRNASTQKKQLKRDSNPNHKAKTDDSRKPATDCKP